MTTYRRIQRQIDRFAIAAPAAPLTGTSSDDEVTTRDGPLAEAATASPPPNRPPPRDRAASSTGTSSRRLLARAVVLRGLASAVTRIDHHASSGTLGEPLQVRRTVSASAPAEHGPSCDSWLVVRTQIVERHAPGPSIAPGSAGTIKPRSTSRQGAGSARLSERQSGLSSAGQISPVRSDARDPFGQVSNDLGSRQRSSSRPRSRARSRSRRRSSARQRHDSVNGARAFAVARCPLSSLPTRGATSSGPSMNWSDVDHVRWRRCHAAQREVPRG